MHGGLRASTFSDLDDDAHDAEEEEPNDGVRRAAHDRDNGPLRRSGVRRGAWRYPFTEGDVARSGEVDSPGAGRVKGLLDEGERA